ADFGSARPARQPHPTYDSDDLFAAASNRAMGERAPAFVRGEVVVGDRRARRPLIRRPMNPERGGEAMEIIRVVGEQVGPSEAPPFPDRIVDVNGASARRRAAATNVSASLPHDSISVLPGDAPFHRESKRPGTCPCSRSRPLAASRRVARPREPFWPSRVKAYVR